MHFLLSFHQRDFVTNLFSRQSSLLHVICVAAHLSVDRFPYLVCQIHSYTLFYRFGLNASRFGLPLAFKQANFFGFTAFLSDLPSIYCHQIVLSSFSRLRLIGLSVLQLHSIAFYCRFVLFLFLTLSHQRNFNSLKSSNSIS